MTKGEGVREPEGLAEFIESRSPALLRAAYFLTGDEHLAEDLVQAALARCWPKWDRIRAGRPEAYVRATMVNLQNSWWQRKWRGEVPTETLPETRRMAAADEGAAERLVIAAALARLPLGQRQVVVLRYLEDRSVEDVAGICGIAAGTVKSQSAKGLARLRELLGEAPPEGEGVGFGRRGGPSDAAGPARPSRSSQAEQSDQSDRTGVSRRSNESGASGPDGAGEAIPVSEGER